MSSTVLSVQMYLLYIFIFFVYNTNRWEEFTNTIITTSPSTVSTILFILEWEVLRNYLFKNLSLCRSLKFSLNNNFEFTENYPYRIQVFTAVLTKHEWFDLRASREY
jgi:hypothetical protein